MNLSAIQIKPITNQLEFEEASAIIDSLVDADLIQDPIERQKALNLLEAIALLAHEYEKKHFSIPKPDPIEAIKERMEQLNLSQKDVAAYFGGKNRVSEVLSGKRKMTLKMAYALHVNLHISPETLLRASETKNQSSAVRKRVKPYFQSKKHKSDPILVQEPDETPDKTRLKKK